MPFTEKLMTVFLNNQTKNAFFTETSVLLNDEIGHKLLTFMVIHPNGKFVERIFSSNEDIYPTGGVKDIQDNYWSELTLNKQESFIGNNKAEIEKYFFDHTIITNLGCESILNQVVVFEGKTIGTINLLNSENYFCQDHLDKTRFVAKCVAPFYLNHQLLLHNR